MIVIDASCVIDMLLRTPAATALDDRLLHGTDSICAPHLIDVEVAQVIRRYVRHRDLDAARGAEAIADLADLPFQRFPHDLLLSRIWELRENLTAYDAAYVALAEALDATLLTRDRKLASTRGHGAIVELV